MKKTRSLKNRNLEYSAAMDAVVRIHAKGNLDINYHTVLDPRNSIFEEWVGSGFFIKIGNEEGYILTNGHVVKNAVHMEIRSVMTSDEPFKAMLVGLVKSLEPGLWRF